MTNSVQEGVSGQWWRWPLMPFAAVIGGALGALLLVLVQWFFMKLQGGFSEDGWMFRYVLPIVASGAFGWIYVWITCKMAPRGKVISGIVMTTILGLFLLANVLIAWYLPRYPIGETIQISVGGVASLVAAVFAVMQVHDEEGFRSVPTP